MMKERRIKKELEKMVANVGMFIRQNCCSADGWYTLFYSGSNSLCGSFNTQNEIIEFIKEKEGDRIALAEILKVDFYEISNVTSYVEEQVEDSVVTTIRVYNYNKNGEKKEYRTVIDEADWSGC